MRTARHVGAMSPDTRTAQEKMQASTFAFKRELVDKMSALATAAFGLVAALAWNNAIQSAFKRWYPAPDDPNALVPLIGYATLVTLVAVLVIIWIGRVAGRLKAQQESAEAATAKA